MRSEHLARMIREAAEAGGIGVNDNPGDVKGELALVEEDWQVPRGETRERECVCGGREFPLLNNADRRRLQIAAPMKWGSMGRLEGEFRWSHIDRLVQEKGTQFLGASEGDAQRTNSSNNTRRKGYPRMSETIGSISRVIWRMHVVFGDTNNAMIPSY